MHLFRIQDAQPPIVQLMADQGRYFTAVNPTPGTGLATIAAQASLVDTAPFVMIIAGTNPVALDLLRLTCTAPGTGGTAVRFAIKTDDAKAAPTGGSQLSLTNVNHGDATTALASVYAGPLVAGAAVAAKLQHHSLLRPVIPVIGDQYLIDFGATEPSPTSALAPAGAAVDDLVVPAPPIIIQAGKVCQLHLWLPGQTVASSWEVDLRLYEYPPR